MIIDMSQRQITSLSPPATAAEIAAAAAAIPIAGAEGRSQANQNALVRAQIVAMRAAAAPPFYPAPPAAVPAAALADPGVRRPWIVRRPSVTNATEKTRLTMASDKVGFGSGSGFCEDLKDFLSTLMEITATKGRLIGQVFTTPHTYSPTYYKDGNQYKNVGIICGYREVPPGRGAHYVAYTMMNDIWYEADNGKGCLVRRKWGPPIWETKYAKTWSVVSMYYFYVKPEFITPLPELNEDGFHGKISFKHYASSCWSDSVEAILVNSDGYRDIAMPLYPLVKEIEPFKYLIINLSNEYAKRGLPQPSAEALAAEAGRIDIYASGVFSNCMIALSRGMLGITPEDLVKPRSSKYKCLALLSLMFIRMLTWEPPFANQPFVTYVQGHQGALHPLRYNTTDGTETYQHGIFVSGISGIGSKRNNKRTNRLTARRKMGTTPKSSSNSNSSNSSNSSRNSRKSRKSRKNRR
jgi:hypothetical protein